MTRQPAALESQRSAPESDRRTLSEKPGVTATTIRSYPRRLRLAALNIDGGVYADVKDPVFDLIVQAAEAWAALTGWRPGPGDA